MRGQPSNPPESNAEREFLAGYDPAQFPRLSVAVDLALMTVEEGKLRALLLQRLAHPARGQWSLPGGFVAPDESLDAAARRVLQQKAQAQGVFVEQLYTFGDPARDPRMRVLSVAHFALVSPALLRAAAAREAKEPLTLACLRVPWKGEVGGPVQACDENGAPLHLSFDHAQILGVAVKRLRGRLRYSPIAFELLPKTFTLRMVQVVHEAILGHKLNKDAFRRTLLASGALTPTGKQESDVGHRPAELYRFRKGAPQ